MTDQRSGAFPLQNDYKDAFRDIPAGYVRGRGPVGRHRIFGPRNPTVTVDSSHIARNPSKAIQGEKEEDDEEETDKPYPHHLFPQRALRACRLDSSNSSSGKRRIFKRRDKKKKKKDRAKMTPEEKRAADLAEKKEQMKINLEKSRAFMNKRLMDRLKHDKINPILRDVASFKRRDPTKLFIKQSETPLWPAISVINNNLRRFCEKHPHVTFFDATDIFAERTERGAYILKSDMISVRGHPTEAGFRAWEDNVAAKLKYMLKDKPAKVKVGDTQSQPSNILPAGSPAASEPKPAPEEPTKKEKPNGDSISESELSGDESKDDGKDTSGDEEEEEAEEDGAEKSAKEDGSGDESEEEDEGEKVASEEDDKAESESQDADNSAESEEEEGAESDDDESSADDAEEDGKANSEEEEEEEVESSEEATEKKATTAKKTVSTKKKATTGKADIVKAVASSGVETAKEGTKKKATSTKKKAAKKMATKSDSEE